MHFVPCTTWNDTLKSLRSEAERKRSPTAVGNAALLHAVTYTPSNCTKHFFTGIGYPDNGREKTEITKRRDEKQQQHHHKQHYCRLYIYYLSQDFSKPNECSPHAIIFFNYQYQKSITGIGRKSRPTGDSRKSA